MLYSCFVLPINVKLYLNEDRDKKMRIFAHMYTPSCFSQALKQENTIYETTGYSKWLEKNTETQ